uniref:Uncharacterized protein n=1 Tax=Kalanchoe fedtschenkoi TaxID=63787 RepID=A0A7N0UDC1_KALFE
MGITTKPQSFFFSCVSKVAALYFLFEFVLGILMSEDFRRDEDEKFYVSDFK